MYATILALHSLIRWLVMASLLFALYRAYRGWFSDNPYSKTDHYARFIAEASAHIQLVLGGWLYLISPIVSYFLHNFATTIHERSIRFFGMEHITMMLIAITLIIIGSAKARRKQTDKEKFRTMAVWFSIGLLLILTSIPWSFSPLLSRPNFRPF